MFVLALKSALLIQRWYRRYQSRIEMRKLTAWHIYQSIEYSGEQDQLKLYDFFLTLIKNSAIIYKSNDFLNNSAKKLTQIADRKHSSSSMKLDLAEAHLLESPETSSESNSLIDTNSSVVNKVLESDLEYMKTSTI